MLDLSFTPNSFKIVSLLDLQFRSRFLCTFYMFDSVPFWFGKQNYDWMARFGQNSTTLLRLVTRLFTTHSRFISKVTIYFPHSIQLLFWDLLGFHQGQTYRHSTPLRRFEKREIRSVWTAIPRGCNNALYFLFFLRWMNFKDFLKRPKTSERHMKLLVLSCLLFWFNKQYTPYQNGWHG